MSPLQTQLDRLKRRRWLVLGVTLVALLGAIGFTMTQKASYTARAALTVSSTRGSDQDALLSRGYVEYFNQDFAMENLASETDTPSEVSFAATASATSSIIFIQATAPSADQAVASATKLTERFRDDINAGIQKQVDPSIAALQKQITDVQARTPATTAGTDQIGALQSRIIELQTTADNNRLKDLQLAVGVTESAPKLVQNALLGLLGGLLLGIVAALLLTGAEDRIFSARQVRERLGVDTLAVVHGGRDDDAETLRAQQMMSLANVVSLSDMSQPATLAVAAVRSTELSWQVAEGLAYYRARQGERTLLIRADLDPDRQRPEYWGRHGLGEFLAARRGIRLQQLVIPGGPGGMLVLPAGTPREEPHALFSPDRVVDLVQQAGQLADLVVFEAPPVMDAAESQVICASADRTILVLEEGITKASEAVEAFERLQRVHANLLGAVIGRPSKSGSSGSAENQAGAPSVADPPTRAVKRSAASRRDEVEARG